MMTRMLSINVSIILNHQVESGRLICVGAVRT